MPYGYIILWMAGLAKLSKRQSNETNKSLNFLDSDWTIENGSIYA